MTSSGTHDAAGTAKAPRRFFHKQLADEVPLSFDTAGRLYELATALYVVQPWNFLKEQDIFLLQDVESGEICYCSIMGALGEIFSLQVYVGAESYRFFRRLSTGRLAAPGDFFASMRAVSVEYVPANERTPPDRELLAAFGYPNKRGQRAPIFRAIRPGYQPWYVTEGEGKLLVSCLKAALAYCTYVLEMGEIDDSQEEDEFPFLEPEPADNTGMRFKLHFVKAPEPPLAAPQPTELDENLVGDILHENLPRTGALEAEHFFTTTPVGERDQRKACVRMALVSDAKSGLAFAPELGGPGDSTGQLLVRALLGAMRKGRFVPLEVRVGQNESKILLGKLAERLGFDVRVTKSLPAVNDFKDHLFEMMGIPNRSWPE